MSVFNSGGVKQCPNCGTPIELSDDGSGEPKVKPGLGTAAGPQLGPKNPVGVGLESIGAEAEMTTAGRIRRV